MRYDIETPARAMQKLAGLNPPAAVPYERLAAALDLTIRGRLALWLIRWVSRSSFQGGATC